MTNDTGKEEKKDKPRNKENGKKKHWRMKKVPALVLSFVRQTRHPAN